MLQGVSFPMMSLLIFATKYEQQRHLNYHIGLSNSIMLSMPFLSLPLF